MIATSAEISQDDFLADIAQSAASVDSYMRMFLDCRPLPHNLEQAVRYSLLGEGKRLRPVLVIRACEAVGGQADHAMAPAAAIEMIHCFSLVHDDLPAMDDDDLRRGRPTLHKHTNEAMAILAGDAMMGLAFELIACRVEPADLAMSILHELSTATNNMIAGQVYDTLPDFNDTIEPIERLRTTHRNKTGALIRCACRMGALSGGAGDPQLNAMTSYGEAIGLMFQVVDDLLDVTQTSQQLGKAAQKDAEHGKMTYPALWGQEASFRQVEQLKTSALEALDGLGPGAKPLRDLCRYMAVRTR